MDNKSKIKLRKQVTQPAKPTKELIEEYLQRWKIREDFEKYRLQEMSLGLLFKEHCPNNQLLEHVLLKVSALNDFYSTNIFDSLSVARHIFKNDTDQRLNAGDLKLVNELARVTIKDKTWNFYSFASKYCNHHYPDDFPIYDSFVEKMLVHYSRVDSFSTFRKVDLKQYDRFVKVIKEFQSYYDLKQFTLRELDIFLWIAGKESFPKSY